MRRRFHLGLLLQIIILSFFCLDFVSSISASSSSLVTILNKNDPLIKMVRQRKAAAAVETRGGSDTVTAELPPVTLSTLTKVRQAMFPIYGSEVKKFLLIGSIKFFIIMALTLTRDTKDTLVVTQCGAEAIAFLKVSNCVLRLFCLGATDAIGRRRTLGCIFLTPPPLDLRSSSCGNSLHCSLHQNVILARKASTILCDVHSILCFLCHL